MVKIRKSRRIFPLLRTERVKTDIMKKENRELMEQMLMAIHAKDTLEMLEELIENQTSKLFLGRSWSNACIDDRDTAF